LILREGGLINGPVYLLSISCDAFHIRHNTHLLGRRPTHLDTYIQVRIRLLQPVSSYAGPAVFWERLMRVSREIPFAYQASLLFLLSHAFPLLLVCDRPRTSMLFSGSFFPLATLSSIEDHMPFSSPSLLWGRSLLPVLTILGPLIFDFRLMMASVGSECRQRIDFHVASQVAHSCRRTWCTSSEREQRGGALVLWSTPKSRAITSVVSTANLTGLSSSYRPNWL